MTNGVVTRTCPASIPQNGPRNGRAGEIDEVDVERESQHDARQQHRREEERAPLHDPRRLLVRKTAVVVPMIVAITVVAKASLRLKR